MKSMKKRGIARFLLVLLLFLTSSALILYPFLANYLFENRTDSLVQAVEETAEEIDDSKRMEELALARKYNDMIANGHIQLQDPFVEEQTTQFADNYEKLLCMNEDGVMGFIKIPSIDVSLPIYHGTAETTLEAGAGHLQGTSLPVGGSGTHSVITGHSGLSNAKMFTDLTELEAGDIFLLTVYGETIAYAVDQIKTVLPYELGDLAIEPEQDLCTLITCTPYGINTHRLLVRGRRTENILEEDNPDLFRAKAVESKWMQEYKRDVWISFGLFVLAILALISHRIICRKKEKTQGGQFE